MHTYISGIQVSKLSTSLAEKRKTVCFCMTSAAELFYNRRSRSDVRTLDLDSSRVTDHNFLSDSFLRHRRSLLRHHRHHRALSSEPEPVVSNNSSPRCPHNSGTSNNNNGRVNRLSGIGNGQGNSRLPGAVLQARARLLERLQGVSPTGIRVDTRASRTSQDEFAPDADFEVADSRDWEIETSRNLLESSIQLVHLGASKKPPGLSCEAISSLPQELFKDGEEIDTVTRSSLDCCICLDRFEEGDRLSHLACNHRFHQACLEPWLRICGDCPYCRARL